MHFQDRPTPDPHDADRVMSLPEWCDRIGVSLATGRRLIKSGDGPVVTWLSARRVGVRVSHFRDWLDSRSRQGAA